MILTISGTNRPSSNTLKITGIVESMLKSQGHEAAVLDLATLPIDLLDPASYAEKPAAFAYFQETILRADGILSVIPEYNGAYPGVMKLFIDMLSFPESLYEKPAAFVGLSAGPWGAVRGVEQLEMVFQYRNAHLYGRRVFIPSVNDELDGNGQLKRADLHTRLNTMVTGFSDFATRIR